jgi:hypothetical protein
MEIGDRILLHGWSGQPRFSKWSWRKFVFVKRLTPITLTEEGVKVEGIVYKWDSPAINHLALLDGIDPATGLELKAVIKRFHGRDWEGNYKIVGW